MGSKGRKNVKKSKQKKEKEKKKEKKKQKTEEVKYVQVEKRKIISGGSNPAFSDIGSFGLGIQQGSPAGA